MFSLVPLKISSLNLDDRSDRYIFGCVYTPSRDKETLGQRYSYYNIAKDKHWKYNLTCNTFASRVGAQPLRKHKVFLHSVCWVGVGPKLCGKTELEII